jgi:MATE family multidrug resistance protein
VFVVGGQSKQFFVSLWNVMKIWRKHSAGRHGAIIRLGVPILIGQLGIIVVAFADNIMVGRYSTEALASASFVNNVFNMANFACMGFSYGLTPLMGALYAQKRFDTIGTMMRTGMWLNLAFTLLVMAIMAGVWLNLDHLGQPAELLPLIRPYYLIVLAGLLPMAVFNVLSQWLLAINRTRLPMWIMLASNAINILGNYALIYGKLGMPEMGLMGAGVSTFIARMVCPLTAVAIFCLREEFRPYRRGFFHGTAGAGMAAQVNRTSWPVAWQLTFESGSFTFAAVMAGWLGAVSLAAFQIIVIIGTLGFCVYYSMGNAMSALVANAAGRGERREMRRIAFAGYHIILALATVSSLTFILFGRDIIGAFTTDAQVVKATAVLIVPLVMYQLGDATQINFANALRGTSHVMPMLWIAFASYMVVGLPATYLLGFTCGLGTYGIVLSFSVSLFMAGALFLYFFLRATRK